MPRPDSALPIVDPGVLGDTRGGILDHLKRLGRATIPELAERLELNVETVRGHLRVLGKERWVRRAGERRRGRGRPEILYELESRSEGLFPNRESRILRDLVRHLQQAGQGDEVDRFFDGWVERRREDALARVEGLEGEERLERVAEILTEQGFMAEIRRDAEGGTSLRLCHCPMRGVVDVTRAPCRAELGFVRELLGERLARVTYIPAGEGSCSYRVGEA